MRRCRSALVVVLGQLAGQLGLLAQALADRLEVPGTSSSTAPKWVRARRSGVQPSTSVERFLPGLDVDVGRRRGGHDQVRGRDPAGGDVADEGGAALLVQVADVVGGVAGGVGDAHAEHRLAAAEDLHVGLGHRHDLAPEALHLVAVEALGAGQQLRGVDQVRGAALVDVDLEVGPAPHQRPGRGGVVEVDVGEERPPAAARRRAPPAASRSRTRARGRPARRRPPSSRSRAGARGA